MGKIGNLGLGKEKEIILKNVITENRSETEGGREGRIHWYQRCFSAKNVSLPELFYLKMRIQVGEIRDCSNTCNIILISN